MRVVRLPDDIEQLLIDGRAVGALAAIMARFGFELADSVAFVKRWRVSFDALGSSWPGERDGEDCAEGDGYAE
jgi:hypothetical protein